MALASNTLRPGQRYALILVDLSVGFTDPSRSPLAAPVDDVVNANRELLSAFRRRGLAGSLYHRGLRLPGAGVGIP